MGQHLAVEHPGLQDRPDEPQHPPVRHPLPQAVEDEIEPEPVEEALDVGVHHPYPPLAHRLPHGLQALMGRALGSEPEAAGKEIGLQDGLEHNLEGRLDHPVAHCSDPERAEFRLSRFGDPYPPHRLRTVSAVSQRGLDVVKELLDTRGLDVGDGDSVDTRSTLVVRAPPTTLAGERLCGRPGHTARGTFDSATAWPPGTACVAGPESLSRVLLGLAAMHRLLPVPPSTDEAGALPSDRVMLSQPSTVLRPPPTPSRLDATSRSTVIRTGCSRHRRPGAGEGLPSSRHHLPHVPAPLRRRVPRRCASRLLTPSMAFALLLRARLPLVPLRGWANDAAELRLMLRTARLLPPKGFRRWAPTPGVSPRRRQPATGLPGNYPDGTYTRWR